MSILEMSNPKRIAFGIVVCFLFINVYMRYIPDHNREAIYVEHTKLIEGREEIPEQYRILMPYIVEYGLKNLFDVQFYNYYRLLDLLFFVVGFWALMNLLLRFVELKETLLGLSFIMLGFPFIYVQQIRFAGSFEFMYFCLGLYLIYLDKRFLLLPLIILGAMNRFNSVFLIFTFAFVFWNVGSKRNYIMWLVLFSAAFVSVQLVIRYYLPGGLHQGQGVISHAILVVGLNLTRYKNILFPLILINVFWFFSFYRYSEKPEFIKRIMLTVPIYLLLIFMLGLMAETRLFIPVLPYVTLSSIYTLFGSKNPV